MIDLSIVILNFNARGFAKKCVESVLNSDLGNINTEIVLVDNNSYDGSKDDLISFNKSTKVQLVFNNRNFGFSKGNNIGAK